MGAWQGSTAGGMPFNACSTDGVAFKTETIMRQAQGAGK